MTNKTWRRAKALRREIKLLRSKIAHQQNVATVVSSPSARDESNEKVDQFRESLALYKEAFKRL